MRLKVGLLTAAALGFSTLAHAQSLTLGQIAGIDQGVEASLRQRGVPSASVAVVRGDRVVFAKAYGSRSISPERPADTGARYNIGSVSKQITATALLILADEGKLSLDDTVGRWLPELTQAKRITVRQVLSHTAGYKSFFLAEVMPAEGARATTPQAVADRWGRQPLDYPPGSDWQYSNTDYTIAALIVERASGQPLPTFLRNRIFGPLGMASAAEFPGKPMPADDAQGYTRYALGPLRPAPIVGAGWELGAGGLSMTAGDLAKWDIGMLRHRLLSAKSYAAQQTAVALSDGRPAPYGLGVFIDRVGGHRRVYHPGSEHGFLTENRVYPDDETAVVVMVNGDFGNAQADIADQIERLVFDLPTPPKRDPRRPRPSVDQAVRPDELALAHKLVGQLATGTVDRRLLTPDLNNYFSPAVLADYRNSLGPLGVPGAFERLQSNRIGGQDASIYRLMWANEWLVAVLRRDPDGRVASFKIYAPL
jgi:D-alanyl-D-alanine carboxypeptidase